MRLSTATIHRLFPDFQWGSGCQRVLTIVSSLPIGRRELGGADVRWRPVRGGILARAGASARQQPLVDVSKSIKNRSAAFAERRPRPCPPQLFQGALRHRIALRNGTGAAVLRSRTLHLHLLTPQSPQPKPGKDDAAARSWPSKSATRRPGLNRPSLFRRATLLRALRSVRSPQVAHSRTRNAALTRPGCIFLDSGKPL
jgi:hypothetical protein